MTCRMSYKVIYIRQDDKSFSFRTGRAHQCVASIARRKSPCRSGRRAVGPSVWGLASASLSLFGGSGTGPRTASFPRTQNRFHGKVTDPIGRRTPKPFPQAGTILERFCGRCTLASARPGRGAWGPVIHTALGSHCNGGLSVWPRKNLPKPIGVWFPWRELSPVR